MKHDERLANDIRNALQSKCNTIKWERFNYCQAFIGDIEHVIIGNDLYHVIPFRSYDTIVAYVDVLNNRLYEIGKYSQTTSKQVTQFYNQRTLNAERVYHKRICK